MRDVKPLKDGTHVRYPSPPAQMAIADLAAANGLMPISVQG